MYKSKIKIFFLIVVYFLLVQEICFSQQGEWVTGEAEVDVINITPEEAKKRAIDDARKNALLTKKVQVTNFLTIFETSESAKTHAFQFTNLLSSGIIIDAKEPVITEVLVPVEGGNILKVRAKVEVCIQEIVGKPDPNFQLDLSLNQDSFMENDIIVCKIKSTQDAYLTIINLASDGKVYFILPSGFRQSTLIRKNKWMEIPNKKERESGISLFAYLPENMTVASEIIMVIATKKPNEVIQPPQKMDEIIDMTWEEMVRKMGRWLASLPMEQKTEAFIQYNIIK